jgi:hypothetical protein
MEELGWLAGPAHISRELATMFAVYLHEKRQSAEPALQAMNLIASHKWLASGSNGSDFGGLDPAGRIELPWWIVFAISTAWSDYVIGSDGNVSLGRAFGIEGGSGRGTHRQLSKKATRERHYGYALEVASMLHHNKCTIETALHDVAERWNASYDVVRRAWKDHGKVARKVLKTGAKSS